MKAILELLRGESEEFPTFSTWETLEEFLLKDSIKNHEEIVKLSIEMCVGGQVWEYSFEMRPSELLQTVFALKDIEERVERLYEKYPEALRGDDE